MNYIVAQSTDEYHNVLAAAKVPIVCIYSTTYCGPCKKVKPLFRELAAKMPAYIFVETSLETVYVPDVNAVPCIVVINNEEILFKEYGVAALDKVMAFLTPS